MNLVQACLILERDIEQALKRMPAGDEKRTLEAIELWVKLASYGSPRVNEEIFHWSTTSVKAINETILKALEQAGGQSAEPHPKPVLPGSGEGDPTDLHPSGSQPKPGPASPG